MITVLALLLVVALDHYLPTVPFLQKLANFRTDSWLKFYADFVLKFFKKIPFSQGKVSALLLILPILLLVLAMNYFSYLLLGGVGEILFMAIVLYYCLGKQGEKEHDSAFILAHEQTFGIIFWFTILGSSGAMLYWLLIARWAMYGVTARISGLQEGLAILHGLAAWIPARITGLIYALVGDFAEAFRCWFGCIQKISMPSSKVLVTCGQAALKTSSNQADTVLVKRAYIAWIVLSIILSIFIALVD